MGQFCIICFLEEDPLPLITLIGFFETLEKVIITPKHGY
jgi:hypothetical protein